MWRFLFLKTVESFTQVFTAWFVLQGSYRPHLPLEASPGPKSQKE